MLLLDRRHGESILIGDDIRVTIFHRPGNRVCVGISAPRDVPVNREEICQRANKRLVPDHNLAREARTRGLLRIPMQVRNETRCGRELPEVRKDID